MNNTKQIIKILEETLYRLKNNQKEQEANDVERQEIILLTERLVKVEKTLGEIKNAII